LVQAVEGGEGLKAFYAERPDVVLLDLGLPNEEGWAVLASIRELSDAPVVAITARDGEAARVRALCSGAHDCVTEPISGPLSRPPSNRSRANDAHRRDRQRRRPSYGCTRIPAQVRIPDPSHR